MKNYYHTTGLQRLFLLLFFSVFGLFGANAQLVVTPPAAGTQAQHATELAQYLVGQGVVVSNAQLTAPAGSYGFFNGTNSNIGIGSGVLLTTGLISGAVPPNSASNLHGDMTPNPYLTALINNSDINDMVMLEFDVQVASDTLRFEYVFASEEYPTYACLGFNDVFGFFINGPGITGNVTGQPGVQNIAYLPDGVTPVTIDNVNDVPGCGPPANLQYYVNNNSSLTVNYNGFTTVLTAEIWGLVPCQVYHLRLAIADVGDDALDSGVFIKQGSLTSQGIQFEATTAVGSAVYPNALEGCVNGGFALKRVGDISQAQTVEFSITGTAQNGFDYFDASFNPLDSVYTFAPGQDSAFIEVWPYPDGDDTEIQETVIFILKSSCVNIVTGDSAILYIDDKIPLNLSTSPAITGPVCEGQPIQINSLPPGFSASGINFIWTPINGLSDDLIPDPIATPPVGTTQYNVYATVTSPTGTCMESDSLTITVEAAPISPAGPDFFSCTATSGTLQGSGGGTYSWVGPNGFTSASATPTFQYSNPGNYILHVTTPGGCEYIDTAFVSSGAPQATFVPTGICVGESVTLQPLLSGLSGAEIYSYSPSTGLSNPGIANPVASPSVTTTYTLTILEAVTMCTSTAQVTVTVNPLPAVNAGADFGVCPGEAIQLSANTFANATYTWNGPDGFTSSLQNPVIPNGTAVQAGLYSLSVTDASGCTATDDVTVAIKPLPQLEAGTPLSICAGDQITIPATVTNGSTITWSPAASLSSATALQPVAFPTTTTTYTATANLDGCETTDEVTVTVTPAPLLSIGSVPPFCLGQTATVTATDAANLPGTSYAWTDVQGTVLGTDSTYTITPSAAGNVVLYYTATPTNAACAKTDSVVLEVKPFPQFSAGADLAVCPQQSVELQATETTGASVTWSPATGLTNPGVVAPIASPTATTTYIGTANLNGCQVTDTVTVTASPAASIVPVQDEIRCWNVPSVTLTVLENSGNPGVDITWAPVGSGTVANGPAAVVSPAATTNYVVTATLGDCAVRDTVNVVFVPDMNLSISATPEGGLAPLGVQFFATGNNLTTYAWDFDIDNLSTDISADQSPTYTYVTPGEYQPALIAVDNMGCRDTATYDFVRVSYGVPNVFTPNGDGINDVFNVGILKANTRLRVLSRWGNVIYESDNYQNDWNAADVPDGVYFYSVSFPDSGEDFKGWVEIHR